MQRHFMVSLQHVREGRLHTVLTSCFSQKDGMHLLANMFTLYFMWNKYLFPSGRLVHPFA
jgi:membrane associated rhomboid family serine protease